MKLKILSWNCHSLQTKVPEISKFLYRNLYHIVLLQETWLNPNIPFQIPNYVCLRQDRDSNSRYPHGGVAILVHSSLDYKRVKFVKLDFVESIYIQISVSNFTFTVGSIYASSSLKVTEARMDLEKLFSRPGPFVLAGDYNAKHISWNNVKNNRKGTDLLRICNKNLCNIYASDEPTAFPYVGAPSILDFVVTKGVVGVLNPIVVHDLSSDHISIAFEIPTISLDFPKETEVWNFAKANWKRYRTEISADLELHKKSGAFSLESKDDIDRGVEIIVAAVEKATQNSVPKKIPYVFRYPHSQFIQKLVNRRNLLRRQIYRYPWLKNEVNYLNRQIRMETRKLNQTRWNEKLAELNVEDNSLFRFAASIKKKRAPVPPLKVADEYAYSDKEKADIIAESFRKSHHISQDPTCHTRPVQDSKNLVEQALTDFPKSEKVTANEVESSIAQLKVRKAPGNDDISNRVLKNIPSEAIDFLVDIYNACLKTSYFPTAWKIGKVVAIPKPGKDHALPGSYRAITLLPTMGKTFEKVILSRMLEHESENQILINQQFGFRSKHSTTQQVLRITESISLRFNEDTSTAMTLLDVEKAFDSVWHDALVHKLMLYNFPMYLIKMIVSFLENRVSFVAINGKHSKMYKIPAGVPQGSPLSPFLFNVFINDIPVPEHCETAIYADDSALIASIKNYELPTLVKIMNSGLAKLENYFSSWKVKLNVAKTESILFTHSRIMQRMMDKNRIKFHDTELEWKQTVKYLGVTLDPKLTFRANIADNHVRARKAMAALYCLLKKNSTLSRDAKITVYRAYIRPIMTYACPVFANCAKCHMQRLQVLQNKCLRMVLNAPFRTRISSLHKSTGIPMIKTFVDKLTDNFYTQSAKSSNKLVSRLGDYSRRSNFTRAKHRLPRPN